jgi:tripartite-type tricarboxylate transporter receptor subunit TctC
VPADRVKALRAAFDAAMKDPAFLAAANKQRVDIEPLGGERLNKIIEDIYASPKELLDRLSSVTAKPKR